MAIRTFPDNPTLFGGTGSDGAFDPAVDYNFDDAEGEWVIKEYSSITIDGGITVSADNRIKGLILYCSGNVTINGEIDLDGLGYGSEQAPPIVYDRYYSGGELKSAWAEYCSGLDGETLIRGGDGGGGGGYCGNTSYTAGDGAHAGGASHCNNVSGQSASGWRPGYTHDSDNTYSIGGGFSFSAIGRPTSGDARFAGGSAGYIGVQNAGGNAGVGATGGYNYNSAALLTSPASTYGGSLLVIIAKGTIALGSTANLHCHGADGGNATGDSSGADGAGGGGCIVLLSEGPQSIDGSATRTVTGGSGGAAGAYGGDGGDGDAGSKVETQVS